MISHISILVSGLLISGLIGYALSKKTDWKTSIKDSLFGAILGSLILTLGSLQFELAFLSDIREEIVQKNALSILDQKIEEKSNDDPLFPSMVHHRNKIEEELLNISNGSIKLNNEDEVITEWKRLFNNVSTNVYATNYVSPRYWTEGSVFSVEQLHIQESALENGINIKRLFIYKGNSQLEEEYLRKISDQQLDLGIEVRFIRVKRVTSLPAFASFSPALGGTIDFVIYDLNSVLLTYLDSSQFINSGIITKERNTVDNAVGLFDRLWLIADKNLNYD